MVKLFIHMPLSLLNVFITCSLSAYVLICCHVADNPGWSLSLHACHQFLTLRCLSYLCREQRRRKGVCHPGQTFMLPLPPTHIRNVSHLHALQLMQQMVKRPQSPSESLTCYICHLQVRMSHSQLQPMSGGLPHSSVRDRLSLADWWVGKQGRAAITALQLQLQQTLRTP